MDGVVQCPVCTLFLHPGMNLDEHLNTHPKDQVIQALTQLTLQRANILSQTSQFVAKSPPPALPAPPPKAIQPSPQPPPPAPPPPVEAPAVVAAPTPVSAVVIKVPPAAASTSANSPPQLFNKQSSISYVQHEPQKSVMIVNSCSTQFIHQRIPNAKRQLEIAYNEQPIQVS